MTEVEYSCDINVIQQNVTEVICDYESVLRSLVSDLLSEVDQKPIQAVHEAVNALDNGYRNFERKLYACFPSMITIPNSEENAEKKELLEEAKPSEAESFPVKRIQKPRKPKAEKLPEKEKEQLAIAKHNYAVDTRLMPLGEIKKLPEKLREVYPYSTVYKRFSTVLLKALQNEGIRTPASIANYSFSQFKSLVNKHSPVEVSNSCILAFADIYGITFAPERETLF